ncbi:unnamed protein product [Cylindrotheca closterium]|uniref:Uncharacterized protein n=1 Tax=Cylindrotheca closterium TaxID=2856 RepID=A0AAD2CIN6_9STRA|nr:unnamed protein product [Cylindrotheca closterium]
MVMEFGTPTRRRRNKEKVKSSPIQDLITNSSPVKFLRSRKGRGASFFAWILLISFSSAFRVLWQSATFTRNLTSIEDQFYGLEILAAKKSNRNRDKRVRPRIGMQFDVLPITAAEESQPTIPSTFASLQVQIPDDLHKIKSLCGKLHGEQSRVLISGVLTHPFGTELALFLSNECGVKKIHAISEHAMDTDSYNRLSFLLKRLPDVEIHLSEATNSGPNSDTISSLFSALVPTHVVHLEALSFLSPEIQVNPTMTSIRNSLNKIERLCEAMTKQSTLGMPAPELIYLTSSSSSTVDEENHQHISYAIQHIIPMLMKTYTAKYNTRVAQLHLPTIFGPMEQSRTILDAALNVNATKPSTPSTLIHITEAVFLTVSCMTRTKHAPTDESRISIPSFQAARSHTQSLDAVVSTLYSLSKGKSTTRNARRIEAYLQMLSWYHKDAHPFTTSNMTNSQTQQALQHTNKLLPQAGAQTNNSLIGVSQLERRTFNLFPCASECATTHTQCLSSNIDESLNILAKNITYDCRYVVYMTDFSEGLQDLPLLRNTTDQNVMWPSDTVCQVAFVSSHSKLVRHLMSGEQGVQQGEEKPSLEEWNGQLSHKRWKLLWPSQQSNDHLVEGDYIMPKIAPGSFMSHNVTKALYLEPNHIEALPSLPVLWFLMSKQLDQRKIPGRDKIVRRSGTSVESTVHIPGIPAKHVALFSHWFANQGQGTAGAMAKDILDQKGIGWERSWPMQQLSFYDYVMRDFGLKLPDTFLVVHNVQSDRSRRLRCEWYEEQLFWSTNDAGGENRSRGLEDLTLAFVLARWRAKGRLIPAEESWGERMLTDEEFKDKKENEDTGSKSTSQYFVKMHRPMAVRRKYKVS